MLVYGDHAREVRPSEALAALRERLRRVEAVPAGIARHAALVALLIEAGELAQGVLDADFAERRQDEPGQRGAACLAIPMALARAVRDSYASGFTRYSRVPDEILDTLERLALPERVTVKMPEGYAYYALYPELYLEAARSLRLLPRPPLVVGIRSIGTSLACVVAAASCTTAPPLTVRPGGHPFQRTLGLGPTFERELLARARESHVAIVDEGPGLSGSSFGAVADFLEDHGVPEDRLLFFPSHAGGLGPVASERHRTRWARARRYTADFDALFVRPSEPPAPLAAWVEDLIGPTFDPLLDVGGGAWRHRVFPDERDWPAVHVQQERRKYLVLSERGTFLLKFAGLGGYGERRLARARQLSEASLTPHVEGLRHGFLIQRWLEGARPLPLARGLDRAELVARVGAYLGFRARRFLAEPGRGATPAKLLEMARYNTAQVLGDGYAESLGIWAPRLDRLSTEVHPVETDNKPHAWEWLVLPDGRLLKADAVDHHDAHDLIGCQDVAWDVVGAAVELNLDAAEQAILAEYVARASGRAVSAPLMDFYRPCYLAFQLGHHTLAASSLEVLVPEESVRLRRAAERYATLLRGHLDYFA
ncbi:hypothetical protein [Archangium sp.]|uniref:hypothetical protein n=1 Tax=Archangium sp. TaxID=1872627 RepID=UPI002D749D56|nr:hypothetical protein [Archangium sp.]HYO58588.1 hypothetical protein [Archangium sp.]